MVAHRGLIQTLQLFFEPRTIVPFLIGTLALGVLSEALFTLLTNCFGTTSLAQMQIITGSLVILLVAVLCLHTVLRQKMSRPSELVNYEVPAPHRGLVLLVSQEAPCHHAIAHHKERLQYLWLIHSQKTAAIAQRLRESYPHLTVTTLFVHDQDIFDPKIFYQLVRSIYQNLPSDITCGEVISDYLGMTSSASVGMVLACVEHGWPVQYTMPKFVDSPDGTPTPAGSWPPKKVSLMFQSS